MIDLNCEWGCYGEDMENFQGSKQGQALAITIATIRRQEKTDVSKITLHDINLREDEIFYNKMIESFKSRGFKIEIKKDSTIIEWDWDLIQDDYKLAPITEKVN